ncbi:hypothetical protein PAMA_010734 [Pampus argenteus]
MAFRSHDNKYVGEDSDSSRQQSSLASIKLHLLMKARCGLKPPYNQPSWLCRHICLGQHLALQGEPDVDGNVQSCPKLNRKDTVCVKWPWFTNRVCLPLPDTGAILASSSDAHHPSVRSPCGSLINEYGLGLALVMKYAVDEINANQMLLPGIKLGYEISDTCRQSAVIVKPTISFLTEKSSRVLSVDCNYTNYETSVAAVIGPYSSEMVSVIGKLLGFFLIPQISYGATSDKFSDKLLYPSFFRTVPSDKRQVDVIALLLRKFEWNWVAVVGSEEEYGQQGVQEFSKIAENMSVCVAYQGFIPVYTDPEPVVKTIINNIQLANVIRRNMIGVWIGSTSWSVHNGLTSLPNIQKIGTVIGFTDKTQNLDLLTAYTKELFTKMSEERMKTPPLVPKILDNICPQCCNLSPANISIVTHTSVQRTAYGVYAAIYSVAQALHNMLGCDSNSCMWRDTTKIYPWKLLEVLQNTAMDINGTHLVFDKDGNPNIGYNLIEWVWKDSDVDFINVGSYYDELSINMSLFKWHTADAEPGDVVCRLQLPLTSIFQTVALSIITSISLQILYVTEFPEKAASHLHILRGPVSWLFMIACCAVQTGFCGWFVREGPSLSEHLANMKINFVRSFLSCPVSPLIGFALMQGFNGVMALISFMCTFMAVKPLHQYNLARDIVFSSLIYCVIWVTFIPIYIGLNEKTRSIVYISFTLASNLGLVAGYYFPKCYLLLRKPELNTPEHFCTFLEGVPPTPSEEKPQTQPEAAQ